MKMPVHRRKNPAELAPQTGESEAMPLREIMGRLFEESFWSPWELARSGPRLLGSRLEGWLPRVDVSETDKEVHIRANLPNVDPRHVNIVVEDNVLTLSGQTEEKREEKGETWYRLEREMGSFQRSIELPSGVDTNKVEASAKNGMLFITIPKRPEAAAKKVEVKVTEKEQ
ncbi:MAG: Hsp20/alpha crystallin family protein [Candidatus Andersenbacteria bacterium]